MLRLEQEKLPKKLKLGFYPYTYVRTTVMKTLLFKKEDYHKMLKMSFSEIARFLQDTNYKKEINEFAAEYSGVDLLELALNRNLAASFEKLMRISPDELDFVIREYVKRYDIEDIKTILRGKFTNMDKKLILESITSAGTLSLEFLTSLLKKESIEEILRNSQFADFSLFKDGLNDLNEKKTLVSIENAFDKYYYSHLMEFSKILPKQGALFRDFVTKEIEILNILTILRLKKVKFGKKIIADFLIPTGNELKDAKIKSLADLDDLEEISRTLEKTEYKNVVKRGIEDFKNTSSLITLETEFYKYLLEQSILLLHQHPLSVDVILGYMFAKDIEVRNIRLIVKGKQLGLDNDFIEKQLVF